MRTALVIARFLLGFACLVYGVREMRTALGMEGMGAVPHVLFGMGSLLAAVFLLLSGLIWRACEFLSRAFTDIILPSARHQRPPLSYRLARRYAQQLRHHEAVEEYEKILRYYPDEQGAYFELAAEARLVDDAKLFRRTVKAYEQRFKTPFPAEFVEIASRSLPPAAD